MATARLRVTKRTVAIVFALALAVLATVALSQYIRGVEDRTLAQGEPVEAFVATDTIPAGTSAQQAIDAGLVVRQPVPRRNVPSGAIGALGDIEGRVAIANISKGEEIVAERFVLPAEAARRASRSPRAPTPSPSRSGCRRASPASSSPATASASSPASRSRTRPRPTSRSTRPTPAAGTEEATQVRVQFILMGVEVLAIGNRTGPLTQEQVAAQEQAPASVLATLALSPEDAERLAFANWEGELQLTLMPEGAPSELTTTGRTAENLFTK